MTRVSKEGKRCSTKRRKLEGRKRNVTNGCSKVSNPSEIEGEGGLEEDLCVRVEQLSLEAGKKCHSRLF